ncbi:GNAT family N-acetyltransferase [Vreelandella sp.]|uniref:GNAT family N-acetyltransferase n=1 Tax=Vreelandella sp. TaxID=3137778 RepID=UPI003BA85DAA
MNANSTHYRIRPFGADDMEAVLSIWLSASVQAHDFIEPHFWQSKQGAMREVYLPASETYVAEESGHVVGFYSLYENTLAAIFVHPNQQDLGLGSALLEDAKRRREWLQLTVYAQNASSVCFYEARGFVPMGEQLDEHTGEPELLMRFSP